LKDTLKDGSWIVNQKAAILIDGMKVNNSCYAQWKIKGLSYPRRLNHETTKGKRRTRKKEKNQI